MVQTGQKWRFVASFVAVASAIAWAAALLSTQLLKPADLLPAVRYLGIATVAGTVAAIVLNNYVWRWPFIRSLLGIPYLSGRWEGWYFRILEKEWRPTAHEITQHALDIAAEAWGPTNWSRGTSASIITDRHGRAAELVWSYKTELTGLQFRTGDVHAGTHYLRLSEREGHRYLEGRYINDRIRGDHTMGAVGFIRLVWVGSSLKGALAFKEEGSWGMTKPPGRAWRWSTGNLRRQRSGQLVGNTICGQSRRSCALST